MAVGDVIDILGDGRLMKRIICEGDGEDTPAKGNEVFTHYIGTLKESGKQFDSSRDSGSKFSFRVGEGNVIEGWDKGIMTMRKGERAMFSIASDLAYGKSGAGDDIPPDSDLDFDVELFDFGAPMKKSWELTSEEKIENAVAEKNLGNQSFKEGDYPTAWKKYLHVMDLFENTSDWVDEKAEKKKELLLSSYLNLGMVCIKSGGASPCTIIEGIAKLSLVLDEDKSNVKALFRRGVLYMMNNELDQAKRDLIAAAKGDPQNREIRARIAELKKIDEETKAKDKKNFGALFNKCKLYDEKKGVVQATEHNLAELPRVFMDIAIDDGKPQRIEFALYSDTVPRTSENFRALCTGEKGKSKSRPELDLHFKGSIFHRVIAGFMIQGGDFTNGDGTGGECIFEGNDGKFEDENFVDCHSRRGLLSMANSGPNTNGSQFFITFKPCSHLDEKHVVFGEIVSGIEVLDELEAVEKGESDSPNVPIKIVDCGEVKSDKNVNVPETVDEDMEM